MFLGRGKALLVLCIASQAQGALARRTPIGGANAFSHCTAPVTIPLRACLGSRVYLEVRQMAGSVFVGLRLFFLS